MKIIMYHYVREYNPQYPFFRFLDIKNFKNQLDFLENKYGFLKRDEWESYTLGAKNDKTKDKVVLTFDDAMMCNYQYVMPELKSRGIWGLFYIPTKPYKKNEMLDVHKIHLLCGAFDGKLLLNYLRSIISPKMLIDKEIKDGTIPDPATIDPETGLPLDAVPATASDMDGGTPVMEPDLESETMKPVELPKGGEI